MEDMRFAVLKGQQVDGGLLVRAFVGRPSLAG